MGKKLDQTQTTATMATPAPTSTAQTDTTTSTMTTATSATGTEAPTPVTPTTTGAITDLCPTDPAQARSDFNFDLGNSANWNSLVWRAGYLGLEFHEGSRRVRRQQVESEPVDLAANNLLWHLLLKLEENGATLLSYEGLLPLWKEHGQDDRPSKETVTDALSRLSKHVKPLRIRAKASKKVGWRLVDTSAPTKSRPSGPYRQLAIAGAARD